MFQGKGIQGKGEVGWGARAGVQARREWLSQGHTETQRGVPEERYRVGNGGEE